jgi:hypothetical protein
MWDAVLSPVTGCTEKRNLLDLLEVMFDGDLSLLLTVKHPTMWTATRRAVPGGVIDFKKVPRPLKATPPPASIATVQPVLGVDPALASASTTLPPLNTPASATAVPGSATAGTSASIAAIPGQRTALPGAPAKKPTMPKIKLQTSRISIGGTGSPAPSPAVGTPIVIKKPSAIAPSPAVTPAAPASASVLPSLTNRESTADSISVQPTQRKSSIAATPVAAAVAAAAAKAKSPTPANDYFGNFTSRMGKTQTPQPAASPAVSVSVSLAAASSSTNNKRKRQDSQAGIDGAGAGAHRPRKLVKIAVPLSYRHKLSPRASLWLETYRTPSPGTANEGDSIRAAGTPLGGFTSPKKASTPHSTSSKASVPRGSATPGPGQSHKPLPSSKPRGPTPTPASKAGSPGKRESATPDASAKPARKPLPGTVAASAPAAQAPPPPPPPAAAAAPATPTAPASKPIFIKFKSKTSNA